MKYQFKSNNKQKKNRNYDEYFDLWEDPWGITNDKKVQEALDKRYRLLSKTVSTQKDKQ